MSTEADPDGKGLSVLLADDSVATTLLVLTLLSRWGFAVQAMRCDAAAARAVDETRYDIAVIGAMAAGAAMVAAACHGDGSAPVPVLALVTASARLDGATAEVEMPVTAGSLREAVRRCLAGPAEDLDADAIAVLWGSADSPIYHRIARVFTSEVRERVARIELHLASGDLASVEVEAHSIKGAAANICAHRIRDAAARLEQQAVSRDTQALPALLAALRAVLEPGIAALERLFTPGHP